MVADACHECRVLDLGRHTVLADAVQLRRSMKREAPGPAAALDAVAEVHREQSHVARNVRKVDMYVANLAPHELAPEDDGLREVEELPERAARRARCQPQRTPECPEPGPRMPEQSAKVRSWELEARREDRVSTRQLPQIGGGERGGAICTTHGERVHARTAAAQRAHLTLDKRVRYSGISAADDRETHAASAGCGPEGRSVAGPAVRSGRPATHELPDPQALLVAQHGAGGSVINLRQPAKPAPGV